jgi:hypothetical protein
LAAAGGLLLVLDARDRLMIVLGLLLSALVRKLWFVPGASYLLLTVSSRARGNALKRACSRALFGVQRQKSSV